MRIHSDLIKSLPKHTWLIWVSLVSFLAFQFLLRISVGILREEVVAKFAITMQEFGTLAGFYYLGYAGMQIPIGILVDRFSLRYIAGIFIFISALGTIIFGYTSTWHGLLFGRFLIGSGSAVGFIAATKAVNMLFPTRMHSIMLGLTVTCGLLGAVAGMVVVKPIFIFAGYRHSFLAMAAITCLIGFIILGLKEERQVKPQQSVWHALSIVKNPIILIAGISGGLMVGTLEGFADAWAIPFFQHIYNFSEQTSINLSAVIFCGTALGGLVLPLLKQHFNSESIYIFWIGVGTCAVFAILFYYPTAPFIMIFWLMLVLGVLCGYQVLIFDLVLNLTDTKQAGIAAAITNSLIMIFGDIFHRIIGLLMARNWDGAINILGQPLYNYYTYLIGLSIIPIGCIIGQLGFLYLHNKLKSR